MLLDEPGDTYQFLLDDQTWIFGRDITQQQIDAGELDEFDLIIVVDTRAKRQLPGIGQYLQKRTLEADQTGLDVLVIDHHIDGSEIGSCRLIDTGACAAGEIVYELCFQADWPIDRQVAQALFAAIATDTGWFRFENSSARAFEIAGELIEAGAKADDLHQRLYQSDPPARIHLLAATLSTLELHCDNRLAVMRITKQMLTDCGAEHWHIENIVNEPMCIGSVIASVLLVELEDGKTRCSLRSKRQINVSEIANQFDGGGHARAAGLTISDNLKSAAELVVKAMKKAIES